MISLLVPGEANHLDGHDDDHDRETPSADIVEVLAVGRSQIGTDWKHGKEDEADPEA